MDADVQPIPKRGEDDSRTSQVVPRFQATGQPWLDRGRRLRGEQPRGMESRSRGNVRWVPPGVRATEVGERVSSLETAVEAAVRAAYEGWVGLTGERPDAPRPLPLVPRDGPVPRPKRRRAMVTWAEILDAAESAADIGRQVRAELARAKYVPIVPRQGHDSGSTRTAHAGSGHSDSSRGTLAPRASAP